MNLDDSIKHSHENTMDFMALGDNKQILKARYISIGGGDIICEGELKKC